MQIRPLTDVDVPFLWEMLHAAIAWNEDDGVPYDEVRSAPELAKIVDGWGREGDRGLVAEENGVPIGAAWYRWWTEDNHVYGFVADDVPEIGIALTPEARGQGNGSALLAAILDLAHSEGIPSVSLAVERANARALRLYVRAGFRIVRSGDVDHVMVKDL